MWKSKIFRRCIRIIIALFILINISACFHAYKFTHFSSDKNIRIKPPEQLSFNEKMSALFLGVDLPRPQNIDTPSQPFKTIRIENNELECWQIDVKKAKGTVLLFHGYGNKKSGMIYRSDEFIKMGYNTVLLDFHGSGGSEGNTTTIGFREAEDVKACYDFFAEKYKGKPIYLMGTSMGAAAIMKCMNDNDIKPTGIILECPFGSMYKTVCNRFEDMRVPAFPFAGMLVFYGGLLNNFWAFDHNPIDYAKKITCPTLLLSGGKDERVSLKEIDDIYENLQGKKRKIIYANSTHESYLNKYAKEWREDVGCFLEGE